MSTRHSLSISFLAAALVTACGGTESNPGPRENPDTCPAEAPEPGAACTGDDRCAYGEETCCGETYDSFVCSCQDGQFACFFTDACLGAILQCPEEFPCSDEECGPGLRAPNVLCEDGSTGGPVCERNDEGVCGWSIRSCPEDVPCAADECPRPAPGAPNYLCKDGSTGGPVCERNDEGVCGWSIRSCPEELCALIDCAPGFHCEVQDVVCVTTPCPPQAMCVPDMIR